MRRKLFTAVSLLSLLLCVATGVLWVRSYRVFDAFIVRIHGLGFFSNLMSGDGGIGLELVVNLSENAPSFEHISHSPSWYPPPGYSDRAQFTFAGFGIMYYTGYPPVKALSVAAPQWFVSPCLAAIPCLGMVLIRRAPKSDGKCVVCRYDLTGNTSGTCPECGTAIPQPSRPA